MAAGRIILPGQMPCIDANGDPAPGARAYFYSDGTTNLAAVFIDNTLTTELSNPVVADARGVWPVMWGDAADAYTVSLTEADGTPLPNGTWSGLSAAIDATLASADLAESAQIAAEEARDEAWEAQEGSEDALRQAQALLADVTGAPFEATSSTSLSITTGSKTIGLNEAGTLFHEGQTIVSARVAPNAEAQMVGKITGIALIGGKQRITFNATVISAPGGTGPFTDWTVALAAAGGGVASVAGLTGAITAADLAAALDITRQKHRRRLLFKELV